MEGFFIEIEDAKENMVQICHEVYRKGLTPGKSGNISRKINDESGCKVIITPSGVSLKDVDPENLVVVDCSGNLIHGQKNPSSELEMHLKIYEKRNDVGGVVHTHSPYITGFSFSNELIPRLEGFGKIKDPYLKVVEYAPPGSRALADAASSALIEEEVIVLKNHGVLTVGTDLDEAAILAEFIEGSAKTVFVARTLSREPILTHLKHSR